MRPGTPTGRAAWLKPERLLVRLPLWALVKEQHGSVGNGRPLRLRTRDAVGSSPTWATEKKFVLVDQPGVLACLSRRRSWVQIPSGTLKNTAARYANRQSGQAQTLVICRFDSDLRHSSTKTTHASVGHWQASVAVTHSPSGSAGSTPARRTRDNLARSSIGRTRAPQARKAGSIPARVTLAKWRNWKTHDAQNVGPLMGVGVRVSPWSLTAGGQVPN